MPPAATKSKYGKICKSQILTLPHPQGHVMSVKCEQSIDGLSVQVWLLYDHPNVKYCTLNVSGTELRTDRRTDGQTDGQTDGRTDDPNTRCPRRTFQAGGIKMTLNTCERVIWNKIRVFDTELQSNSIFFIFWSIKNHDEFFHV